ncbi:heme-NO-binding protein [Gillisia sp. Hel_I_86]|uniref:heme NO-binding domain-containing protein n=1 Tax=Gillisia sp. Hel_I_86 TaxID=1249981 RepID=UPI00119C886F|nr:heme NO-binding domain-containing protein [Gillisia sp. Hel_I_86]TVZ27832.1 heme-NO-binding protein [Gillisia sp. Hel_I_86]
MKGIVFTEFLEMVETLFGLETVDFIITESKLKSQGAYTSVGVYDFFEMQQLIIHLSEKTNISKEDLIYTYGCYFFNTLLRIHPDIFKHYSSPFTMLASVQDHIHVQVKKLYPGADLPTFEVIKFKDDYLEMIYHSNNAMYMFAKALMDKTFEHYDQDSNITYIKLKEDGTKVRFLIS